MNQPPSNLRLLFLRHTAAVTAAVLAGSFLLSGAAVAETHYYPNAPDSFLKYQVDSTGELVAALRSDKALRQRYARHFGIAEGEVIEWAKNALVPYRLPADRQVTVYGITSSGRIYGVRERMRKGTRVWANRSGVPILKWLCANPLTKTLPGTKLAKAKPTKAAPETRATKVAGARSLAPIPADVPLPVTESPLAALAPQVPTALTTPNVPVVVAALPPSAGPAPAVGGGSGNNYGYLFPVGLILLSSLTGGGGGGTGSAGSSAGPPDVPPPVAPEPGSLALVLPLLGGVGMAGIVRRRRRG